MTRPIPFTKAQIRRAVKGAEAAGLRVTGIKVDQDGSIKVDTSEKVDVQVDRKGVKL